MKNIGFVIILVVVLFSCNSLVENKEKANAQATLISVTIENADDDFVRLKGISINDTAFRSKGNTYNFSLKLNQPEYAVLITNDQFIKLYVRPGDSLEVRYQSASPFESLQFFGKGTLPNYYLKYKYKTRVFQSLESADPLALKAVDYKHFCDSLYVVQKILLEEFSQQNNLDDSNFLILEQKALKYHRASMLLELPIYGKQNQSIPNSYFGFLNKASFNDSSLLVLQEYRTFLSNFIQYKTEDVLRNSAKQLSPSERTLIKLQQINKSVKNQAIKDYLLFHAINDYYKIFGFEQLDDCMAVFFLHCKNTEYRQVYESEYQQWQKLNAHAMASEVNLLSVDGKELQLEEFRGSYLYIDVWATWCLPCRSEAKYFSQLEKEFAHKNVKFISLAIDEKPDDWRAFLDIHKSEGLHYWVKNHKEFIDDFQIKAVPRFILIDPEGKIIKASAPKPSGSDKSWIEKLPNKKLSSL